MIKFKISGIREIVEGIQVLDSGLPHSEIDAAVKESSLEVVRQLKANYEPHRNTGALIASISTFQRKRKGNADPYYTYYVGPRYGGGKNQFSYGGNAAHLLEWGTVDRYRANKKQGGVSLGKGRQYGAKSSTGKVAPLGIIRRTFDEARGPVSGMIADKVLDILVAKLKREGFQVK